MPEVLLIISIIRKICTTKGETKNLDDEYLWRGIEKWEATLCKLFEMKRSLRKKYNFYYFNRSKVFSDVLNYARTTRFFSPNKEISKCSGSVWSKSSISQKIVPRNHNSKSLEVKQFINVRSGPGVACGTIA